MPLYTDRDGMKLTLKFFGKAWRDRLPVPDDTLSERLERALQRLAAMEGDGRGPQACDPEAEGSEPGASSSSDGSDRGGP